MQKKPKQQESEALSDQQLLQQSLEGVVPLKHVARSDSRKRPQQWQKKSQTIKNTDDQLQSYELSPTEEGLSIDSDDSHRKHGVQLRVLKRLKRGHYPLEDQLDLHHLNTHNGKSALLEFIHWSCQRQLTCIRIIHGKGLRSADGPKLKFMCRDLLRSHSRVMAFVSCKPGNGGDGATDVLLK